MARNRQLIAGNWKMNGRREGAAALAGELVARVKAAGDLRCDLLVCPPAPLLVPVAAVLAGSPIALGGQDCHADKDGAHTGDVSAAMLADVGCGYVIVGHSERRTDHRETDAMVKDKAAAAHGAGLIAVVCVGETLAQRDRGETLGVVERQVLGSLPDGSSPDTTVVAYEPVWAIGTGRTPTPEDVAAVHGHLRRVLAAKVKDAARLRLLYGGSVKPDNAKTLLAVPDVDGALVGGASLKAADFWGIATGCP
jgi:triosephosphate isomerase